MRDPADHAWVWKIVEDTVWKSIPDDGHWDGAPVDHRDGFIHLSTADQAAGTLAKHFTGQSGLLLLGIPVDRLPASSLRWEVSRGGDLFPHLYGRPLQRADVARVVPLHVDSSGLHKLPADLPT